MSEIAFPRRVLHLVVEGFPTGKVEALAETSRAMGDAVEIFPLNEASAKEALEKIFQAETVAIWGGL